MSALCLRVFLNTWNMLNFVSIQFPRQVSTNRENLYIATMQTEFQRKVIIFPFRALPLELCTRSGSTASKTPIK